MPFRQEDLYFATSKEMTDLYFSCWRKMLPWLVKVAKGALANEA